MKYKYEDWDIEEPIGISFDDRIYVDLKGNLITGVLEGFYGHTVNTGDETNCQYVENGKRVMKNVQS